MDKGFRFVDGRKTDRSTRRFARSHAMKGRNIGKIRQPRSGLKRDQPQESSLSAPAPTDAASQPLLCSSLHLAVPAETTPRSLGIIQSYFTSVIEAVYFPQLCLSLEKVKSYWLQTMFTDKTLYHCSLALMATLNEFVFASTNSSLEAIYHLGQAVSLVKQNLDTAQGLSNSNISVVNFLVVRDIHRGEHSSAEIHFYGLRKMIELRGGISHLDDDLMLTLKICKTDIDYAFHYGNMSSFYRDKMPQVFQTMALDRVFTSQNYPGSKPSFGLIDPILQQILIDTQTVAHWCNKDGQGSKADPSALQEAIVSIGYRLVQYHNLAAPSLKNKLQAAYHIGLIAFLTTLFLQSRGQRFIQYSLVSRCLRDAVEEGIEVEDEHALVLWLLFVGGISVLREDDEFSLGLRISRLSRALGITSWDHLSHLLRQFPWIGVIHDEPARALWERASMAAAECTS